MPNYQQSKIYSIKCFTTNQQYIGATTKPFLYQRLREHVYAFKCFLNHKGGYCTSFEIIKHDNFKIELMENCPCHCVEELSNREKFYIKTLECINKKIPNRTIAEYYIDNITKYKEYYLSIKNDDKFKKLYTCHCGGTYSSNNKMNHFNTHKHKNYNLTLYNIDDLSPPPPPPQISQPSSLESIRVH